MSTITLTQADVLRAQIAQLIGRVDYEVLRNVCKMDTPDVLNLAPVKVGAEGDQYGFIDNNSNILAVCHADYVANIGRHFGHCKIDDWDHLVFSPQLDDRLGVYTILYVLPVLLGTKFDILITDKEEVGASTAGNFKTTKQYNWMFSFDRRDDQTVMYKYDTVMRPSVTKHFGAPGIGSFSDICRLGHLKCGGFNVATGYSKEHTETCYASMKQWAKSVINFARFFNEHKDTHFKFKEPVYTTPVYGGYQQKRSPFVAWFGPTASQCQKKTDSSSTNSEKGTKRISLMDQALGRDKDTNPRGSGKRCVRCGGAGTTHISDGTFACQVCLNKDYVFCSECMQFVLKSSSVIQSIDSTKRICRPCARRFKNPLIAGNGPELCGHCNGEGSLVSDEITWFDDMAVGPECASYKEAKCNICGRVEKLKNLRAWTRDCGMLNVCPRCDSRLFKKYFREGAKKDPFEEIEGLKKTHESQILEKMTCTKCHAKTTVGEHFGGTFFCTGCIPKVSSACDGCGGVFMKKHFTKTTLGNLCPMCTQEASTASMLEVVKDQECVTEDPDSTDNSVPTSEAFEHKTLP